MATTYLSVVNEVLKALNEVELTSSNFSSSTGFHAHVRDSVNRAIFDLYTEENNEWPFAWAEVSVDTAAGTQTYTLDSSVTTADWESFRIQKPQVTVSSITQAGGTATVTTSSNHYLVTGDTVSIYGADQAAYNGEHSVTVNSTTEFTYSVDSSTTSPATGTIYCYPPFDEEYLEFMGWDQYRQKGYLEKDRNTVNPENYEKPERVVRRSDNSFLITPKPDRVYPIVYEGFLIPNALSAYDDTLAVPDKFVQLVVDKTLHYAYMFRDNLEQADYAQDRYKDNANKLRRILIHKPIYMQHS
jgi:hypothetical protein